MKEPESAVFTFRSVQFTLALGHHAERKSSRKTSVSVGNKERRYLLFLRLRRGARCVQHATACRGGGSFLFIKKFVVAVVVVIIYFKVCTPIRARFT